MSYQQLTEGKRYQTSALPADSYSQKYCPSYRRAPDNHWASTHGKSFKQRLWAEINTTHRNEKAIGSEVYCQPSGLLFAEHAAAEEAPNAKTYFAYHYSSWERRLNENINGLLRQYFPKGMDLSHSTDQEFMLYRTRGLKAQKVPWIQAA